MCERKGTYCSFEMEYSSFSFSFQLDRLTKLIETVQKEINARYPNAETSPGNFSRRKFIHILIWVILF